MTSPKLLTDDLMQRFIAHGYLCLGILRLATRYDAERLDAACARALALGTRSYSSLQSAKPAACADHPAAWCLFRTKTIGCSAVSPPPSGSRAKWDVYAKQSFGCSTKLIQQRLGLLQIGGIEPLGEPAKNRNQQIGGAVALVLFGQHSRERRSGAKFK
jgi:hypothetical protein